MQYVYAPVYKGQPTYVYHMVKLEWQKAWRIVAQNIRRRKHWQIEYLAIQRRLKS